MKRAALISLFLATSAMAEVGTVVQVTNGQIVRDGQAIEIDEGSLVEQGDILEAAGNGIIHVELLDETRFVVYPGSSINIDTALIGSEENRFESLTVGVTSGIFRLVSGESDSDAYLVTTPSATMGIRGTIGDVNVLLTRSCFLTTLDQTDNCMKDPLTNDPIPETCVVPDLCEVVCSGPSGMETVPVDTLRVLFPSIYFSQIIHPNGWAGNQFACSPDLIADIEEEETLPALDDVIEEHLEEINFVDETSDILPLEEVVPLEEQLEQNNDEGDEGEGATPGSIDEGQNFNQLLNPDEDEETEFAEENTGSGASANNLGGTPRTSINRRDPQTEQQSFFQESVNRSNDPVAPTAFTQTLPSSLPPSCRPILLNIANDLGGQGLFGLSALVRAFANALENEDSCQGDIIECLRGASPSGACIPNLGIFRP